MTTQPIASSPVPSGHRRIRTAAGITAIAALIATGGYVATTVGPDTEPTTTPAAGTLVSPSAYVQRELHQSIAGQYGSRSAPDATVNPTTQVRRELHASIAGQYGPAR